MIAPAHEIAIAPYLTIPIARCILTLHIDEARLITTNPVRPSDVILHNQHIA